MGLIAGVSSGFGLSLAFPPADVGPLAAIALVPIAFVFRRASARTIAAASFGFGVSFFSTLLSWVWLFGAPAYVGLVILQSLIVGVALLLGLLLRGRLGGLAFPIAYMAGEYLRSHLPLGGFGWGGLGYSQHNNPIALRLAPFAGVWGLSLVVVLINTSIASALPLIRSRPRAAAARLGIAALLALAPAVLASGVATGRPARIAMIQGNVPENTLDPNSDDFTVLESHLRLTRQIADEDPSLVIWAESSFGRDPIKNPVLRDSLSRVVTEVGAPFLVGATLESDGPAEGDLINANLFLSANGQLEGIYAKQHPVPFGEYVPLRSLLVPLVKELERVPFDVVSGTEATTFTIDEGTFGSVICYESTYPSLVRKFVRNGARFLVVSTNNSSFNRTAASAQHVAFSQLRAAENRMWVAHTAISGISAVVAPDGKVVGRTELFEEDVLLPTIRFASGITAYARWGDWLPIGILLMFGTVALADVLGRRRRREPAPAPSKSYEPVKPLVVIPTFNEAATIDGLIDRVLSTVPKASVLAVDDSSPDGTAAIVRQKAQGDARVFLLEQESKRGLGRAYVAGFTWGLERDFSHFVEMDADLSHDPADLPRLIAATQTAHVVIGSRYVSGGGVRGWSGSRLVLSRAGNAYARFLLRFAVRDSTSGFRCYTRSFLQNINLPSVASNGYAFQIDMTYRALKAGFHVVEIPIVFRERLAGTSKMSRSIVLEAVVSVAAWRLRDTFLPGRKSNQLNPPVVQS